MIAIIIGMQLQALPYPVLPPGLHSAIYRFRRFVLTVVAICVGIASPSLGFSQQTSTSAAAGSFVPGPGVPYPTGGNPPGLVSGDFNGDGILDFAIADNLADTVQILLGDGKGGFSAAPGTPLSVGVADPLGDKLNIVGGDFNRDGKTDLAILHYLPSGLTSVSVLLSNGSGGLTVSFSRDLNLLPPGVALTADFNGDGNPDLVIADLSGLTVLIGDGRGGLSLGTGGPAGVSQPVMYPA